MTTKEFIGIMNNAPCATDEERVAFLLDSLMGYSWHLRIDDNPLLVDALRRLEDSFAKAKELLVQEGMKFDAT